MRRLIRPLISRATRQTVDEDLAHALKNDIVGKINHFGITAEQQITALHQNLTEQYGLVSTRLSKLERSSDRQHDRIQELAAEIDLANRRMLEVIERTDRYRSSGGPLELAAVDAELADTLNRASAADGPLREAGLFMNGPLTVIWHRDGPRVEAVNERILEVPYVLAALADLGEGARVLDVGGGESTLGLTLASRGLQVDLVEPGGYPLEHPNLVLHEAPIEDVDGLATPDAIVLLSTIEHLGVGAYRQSSDDDLDLSVMARLRTMAGPSTRLVLTTPIGETDAVDDLQRRYGPDRLRALLAGWRVVDARTAVATSGTSWVERRGLEFDGGAEGRNAAMLTAVPADDDTPAW